MPTYTEQTTLEGYYKNDNDKYVIVKLTDEVFKDGVSISSKLREVNLDEAVELGDAWDETTICKVTKSVRRPKVVETVLDIPVTQATSTPSV